MEHWQAHRYKVRYIGKPCFWFVATPHFVRVHKGPDNILIMWMEQILLGVANERWLLAMRFNFNSALTALPDGKFEEKAHNQLVQPIRRHIMDIDGVTGCNIQRYFVEVQFTNDVVSRAEVTQGVRFIFQVMAEAQEYNFFPNLGNKTLKVTPVQESRSTSYWVYADLGTALVDFFPDHANEGWDKQKFREVTAPIVNEMVKHDGVLDYVIRPFQVGLRVDVRVTTIQATKDHLREVLTQVRQLLSTYPFLEDDAELKLKLWHRAY